MKNLAILFAVVLLAGCAGMRSSGAGSSGATLSGSGGSGPGSAGGAWGASSSRDYATTADPRLGMADVRMSSQNALEGPFSGLTWQR